MTFNVFVYKRERKNDSSNIVYIVYIGKDNNYKYKVIHSHCPIKRVTYRILDTICERATSFNCIGQGEFKYGNYIYTLVQHYIVER